MAVWPGVGAWRLGRLAAGCRPSGLGAGGFYDGLAFWLNSDCGQAMMMVEKRLSPVSADFEFPCCGRRPPSGTAAGGCPWRPGLGSVEVCFSGGSAMAMVFLPTLDKEEFRSWLASKPSHVEVGTPNSSCYCPIARWILDQVRTVLPELASSRYGVYVGPQTVAVRVDDTEIRLPTPAWAREFIRVIDDDFYHDGWVSASSALAVLEAQLA
jgi:hypothetical protein